MTTFPAKSELRSRVLADRRARSAAARIVAHAQIAAHLAPMLVTMARERQARSRETTPFTVCSYLPLPSEPLPPTLSAELVAAGMRILVPLAERDGPLDWCVLDEASLPSGAEPADRDDSTDGSDPVDSSGRDDAAGEMGLAATHYARGPFGILQPTGPRLGPLAIRSADVVLVPALAVDIVGTRLGRGAGHYDRSLALLDPAAGMQSVADTARRAPAGTYVTSAAAPASTPRLIAVLFDEEIVDALPREPHDVSVTDVVTPEFGLCRIAPQARHVAPDGPHGASST